MGCGACPLAIREVWDRDGVWRVRGSGAARQGGLLLGKDKMRRDLPEGCPGQALDPE